MAPTSLVLWSISIITLLLIIVVSFGALIVHLRRDIPIGGKYVSVWMDGGVRAIDGTQSGLIVYPNVAALEIIEHFVVGKRDTKGQGCAEFDRCDHMGFFVLDLDEGGLVEGLNRRQLIETLSGLGITETRIPAGW